VPDPASNRVTVHLSVYSSPPAGGLAGAQAELASLDGSQATFEAFASPEGRIDLNGVPPGRYRAVVRKEGYGDAVASVLDVAAAGASASVTMLPGGPLAGRVTDPAGRPIPGASLCIAPPVARPAAVLAAGFAYNRTDLGPACAQSGADGAVTVPSIPYGHYKMTVEAPGFGSIANETVELRAGSEPRTWVLSPAGAITGRVLDSNGQAVAGVKVTFRDRVRGSVVETTTDDGGTFRSVALAAGSWRVELAPEEQRPLLRDAVTVKVAETTDLGVLRARAAFAIAGRIAGPDGKPAVRADVRAVQKALPRKLLRTTTTDENGAFRLPGLAAGVAIDLLVKPAPGLTAATFTGFEAPAKGVGLALEQSGRLTGVVRAADGSVPARAYVSAFPGAGHPALEANAGQASSAPVDAASGAFTLENVPLGGNVEVRVSASGLGEASARVEALDGTPLELTLSSREPEVQGRVVDTDGLPVAGASLGRAASDEQGRFRLPVADAGSAKVVVTHPSYAPRSEDLGKPGADEALVVLDSGGTIEGTVTDADGKPVAGVRVASDTPGRTAVSGVGGRYRIEHLPLGPNWMRRQGLGAIGDTEAAKVNVEGAQVARADFRIGAVELAGTLTRAGAAVEGFELTLRQPPENDGDTLERTRTVSSATDEEGRFSLPGLAPGPARLTLHGVTETFVLLVDVPEAGAAAVALRLPGRVLEGIVLDDSGKPIPGAIVASKIREEVPAELAPRPSESDPADEGELDSSAWSRAATDAAGKFRVVVDDTAPSTLAVCTCSQGCLSVPVDGRGEGEAVTLWYDPRLRKPDQP